MEALEAVGKRAAAVKPQAAWFEVAGAEGMAALESLLRQCRNEGLLLIGDAKRGDIGVSSQAYARAWLAPGAPLECDALTVNPWLGGDAMQPLVQAAHCHGKGIYALARTSNPGSAAWQTVRDEAGEPLWARVAEGMQGILPGPHTGFVVGALCIDEGAQLRERHPQAPLLVPGLGAQGGRFLRGQALCRRRRRCARGLSHLAGGALPAPGRPGAGRAQEVRWGPPPTAFWSSWPGGWRARPRRQIPGLAGPSAAKTLLGLRPDGAGLGSLLDRPPAGVLGVLAQQVVGQHQRRHGLDDGHGAQPHAGVVPPRNESSRMEPSAWRASMGARTEEVGLKPTRSTMSWPVEMPPRMPPALLEAKPLASVRGGVAPLRAVALHGGEAVADLDRLGGVDGHHGPGQVGVQLVEHGRAQPGRHAQALQAQGGAHRIALGAHPLQQLAHLVELGRVAKEKVVVVHLPQSSAPARTSPTCSTQARTCAPSSARSSCMAMAPPATRMAVSRAEARPPPLWSRTPYLRW